MTRQQHVTDDDLVLYFYGEHESPARIERAIDSSPELLERYAELERTLALVEEVDVPEPAADTGKRLWRRLEPRLEKRIEPPRVGRIWNSLARWLIPPRTRMVAVVAATLLVALALGFFAGRQWPAETAGLSSADRQRILAAAVAEHLERSERLLVELANASQHDRVSADRFSADRTKAADLVTANRLYRHSSRQTGRADLAWILEDLERLLLEIVHASSTDSATDDAARERLDSLVFKLRVVRQSLRLTPPMADDNPPARGGTTL